MQAASALAIALTGWAAAAPQPRKMAVVLFNFKNDDRRPADPAEMRRRIFTDPDSTRAFYREQSFGQVELVGRLDASGDIFGWYTLDAYNLPCTDERWRTAALGAARNDGLEPEAYDHIAFFFPYTNGCPALGVGDQPGRITWTDGTSLATFTHELGHNFGLPHASARLCSGANGERLALGGSCRDLEYGNPFDVMGSGPGHTNAYNKALAHWLPDANVEVIGEAGSYTLHPQERPSSGTQLLVLQRDASTYYYLEYRQPFGFDRFDPGDPITTGVTVLLSRSLGEANGSYLLDMTPETATLTDAALGLGMSYDDDASGIRLTVTGLGPDEARVDVELSQQAVEVRAPAGCQCSASARPSGGAAVFVVVVALGLRRRRWRRLALLGSLLLGCGGKPRWPDASSEVPDGPPALPKVAPGPQIVLYDVSPAVEEACGHFAEVTCARIAECAPGRLINVYFSLEFCRARFDESCRLDFLTPARNEVPAQRTACSAARAGQTCRDFLFDRPLAACEPPPGALPAGGPCRQNSECGAGLLCQTGPEGCGRCRLAIGVGGDCGWWTDGCVPGARCFDGRCLPPLEAGEACKTTPAQCRPGLGCTPAGCVEQTAPLGTPCLGNDLCDPIHSLHCDLTTGLCQFWLPAVPAGAPCGLVTPDGSTLTCVASATCFGRTWDMRTCVPIANPGEPCDPAQGRACKAPSVCSGGSCVIPAIVSGGSYLPRACP